MTYKLHVFKIGSARSRATGRMTSRRGRREEEEGRWCPEGRTKRRTRLNKYTHALSAEGG